MHTTVQHKTLKCTDCLHSAADTMLSTDVLRTTQVFSIRAAATDNLAKLAKEFGADWAQEHLVPQVRLY